MCSGDRKLNLVTFGNEIIGYVTKSTYHTSNPKSCVMYHFAVCNAEIKAGTGCEVRNNPISWHNLFEA